MTEDKEKASCSDDVGQIGNLFCEGCGKPLDAPPQDNAGFDLYCTECMRERNMRERTSHKWRQIDFDSHNIERPGSDVHGAGLQ